MSQSPSAGQSVEGLTPVNVGPRPWRQIETRASGSKVRSRCGGAASAREHFHPTRRGRAETAKGAGKDLEPCPTPAGEASPLDRTPNLRSMFAGLENPVHLLFLLLIVLVVFGPKRLPELGRSLGHGMRHFRESLAGEDKETPPAADGEAANPTERVTDAEHERNGS